MWVPQILIYSAAGVIQYSLWYFFTILVPINIYIYIYIFAILVEA